MTSDIPSSSSKIADRPMIKAAALGEMVVLSRSHGQSRLVTPARAGSPVIVFREVELSALRKLTATQKIAAMHALWRTAWVLKASALRARHPEWTDGELHAKVREAVSGDRRCPRFSRYP